MKQLLGISKAWGRVLDPPRPFPFQEEGRKSRHRTVRNSQTQPHGSQLLVMAGNTDRNVTISKGSVCGLHQHDDGVSEAGECYYLVASQLVREAGCNLTCEE